MNCPFESQVLRTWPAEKWRATRILLAVSGGADSVALLRCLKNCSREPQLLDVAHFNHGWRGAESDQDERFVRQLSKQLGLSCHVGYPPADASKSEQTARELRYQFLTHTAYAVGARYVVAAHTADDCVETMLHNLFRGTGLDGVQPLDVVRPLDEELVLARPLLRCTRRDVLTYLQSLQQEYREDSSNADVAFRRNFLRQQVLPLVRSQYGPAVDQKLLSFGEIVAETTAFLQELAAAYLGAVDGLTGRPTLASGLVFPSHSLLNVPWPVLRTVLVQGWHQQGWPLGKMTRAHWNQIRDLHASLGASSVAGAESSQPPTLKTECHLPGNLELASLDGWIIIKR